MRRLALFLALLAKGRAVADPARWKARQITATALVGVMYAALRVAESYGITIPVDHATLDAIAVAVLAVVNVVLTVTTSDKVGLPVRDKQRLQDLADRASHPGHRD